MTLARPRRASLAVAPALVAGNVRFVPGVSDGHSPTAGTADGSSIPTTVGLAAGSLRRNTSPSDAMAETSARIPSADTSGFAPSALDVSALVWSLDFLDELTDLGRGSWECSLPDSSSLGGDSDSSPRRSSVPTAERAPDASQTLPKTLRYLPISSFLFPSRFRSRYAALSHLAPSCRHPPMALWLQLVRQSGTLSYRHRHKAARRAQFLRRHGRSSHRTRNSCKTGEIFSPVTGGCRNAESSVISLLASPPRSASAIARSIKQRRGGRAIKKISRSLR